MKTNPPWINRLRERREGREALEKWRKEEAEKRAKERNEEKENQKRPSLSHRVPGNGAMVAVALTMAFMPQGGKLK